MPTSTGSPSLTGSGIAAASRAARAGATRRVVSSLAITALAATTRIIPAQPMALATATRRVGRWIEPGAA